MIYTQQAGFLGQRWFHDQRFRQVCNLNLASSGVIIIIPTHADIAFTDIIIVILLIRRSSSLMGMVCNNETSMGIIDLFTAQH